MALLHPTSAGLSLGSGSAAAACPAGLRSPACSPPPPGRQSPNSAQHKSRSQGQRSESVRAGANPPWLLSARAWNKTAGYPEFFSGFIGNLGTGKAAAGCQRFPLHLQRAAGAGGSGSVVCSSLGRGERTLEVMQ